ncbi:DUF6025 family protein [Pigmentibacter sp. JX0631]|uniref:DUF6025 family protein n=1 Tax=Pigmentibacter sp. JX0631 TaxID=2976982 RepID=UPI002468FE14|nr:DUF6025 family protein [Pigmentibacter sp. JX0631]WGL60472.1 DUF6025 family protein [Pigmentibacter sp. JX0631]
MIENLLNLIFKNKKFNQQDSEIARLNLEKNLRDFGIAWIHLGYSSLKIHELIEYITKECSIKPPRTGHLGNWHEIMAGRSCALDHNFFVCKNHIGFAYITEFTMTENSSLTSGDTVYLPGSLVYQGKRIILPLFFYNERNKWQETDKNKSYFCPFITAKFEDKIKPLIEIQKNQLTENILKRYVGQVYLKYKTEIKNLLFILISDSIKDNSKITPSDIIDRVVFIGGELKREKLHYINGKFTLLDKVYVNIDNILEDLFSCFYASINLLEFIEYHSTKKFFPFLSLSVMSIIDFAIFQIENRDVLANTDKISYLEWGAFGSAGYPPKSKGYFVQKFPILKQMYKILHNTDPKLFKKIVFIVIPSTIFNLLPNTLFISDKEHLKFLFSNSKKFLDKNSNTSSDILMKELEKELSLNIQKEKLSWYFKQRFSNARTIQHSQEIYEVGNLELTEEFSEISIQLACQILGFFTEEAEL